MGGRSYGHQNQIFSHRWVKYFSYPWCSACAPFGAWSSAKSQRRLCKLLVQWEGISVGQWMNTLVEIWSLFLKSLENFSGPKSHLWNCQPLVLESRSLKVFQQNKKKKDCEVWRLESTSFLRYKEKLWHLKMACKVSGLSRNGPLVFSGLATTLSGSGYFHIFWLMRYWSGNRNFKRENSVEIIFCLSFWLSCA